MRTILQSHKPAFTMLELIFVMVVLGIIASYAMPRMNRDLRQEAADAILSDIRFTQHLAVNDNKHDGTNTWQGRFWNITFRQCAVGGGWYQTIYSDANLEGNADANEIATDPSNGMFLGVPGGACDTDNTSPRILLSKRYDINNITSTCGNNRYIGFDYLGRPHNGFLGDAAANNYHSYLSANENNNFCEFKFTFSDNNIQALVIRIIYETGYAFIVGQPDS